MSEIIINSFSNFASSIERETQVLKCLTNLRSVADNSENILILKELDICLQKLEEDFESLEFMIDEEAESVSKFEELCSLCKQQSTAAKQIQLDIQPLSKSSDIPEVRQNMTSSESKRSEAITQDEFERVSKTTRGRLTLNIIQKSYKVLLDLFAKKKKVANPDEMSYTSDIKYELIYRNFIYREVN